mgnify:CR=1 FL=1
MVDVKVVVAHGSRGLELGELLLSVVLRCLLAKMSYIRRQRCLEVAWQRCQGRWWILWAVVHVELLTFTFLLVMVSMPMWSCRRWSLERMCSWASSRRWGRSLVGLDEGFDLLHFSLHLGIVVVFRGIELVVVVDVVDRRWNALPIHHKTQVEVSRKWDKQY